ncbi:MAG: hypothetical protein ABFS46_05190 [Myxococcota bacterium]
MVRSAHPHPLVLVSLVGLLACGSSTDVSSGPDAAQPVDMAGLWEVQGTTVEKGNEESKRQISGMVVLSQEGGRFTSTFEMKTKFPTPGGASVDTDVIGKGEGTIAGSSLSGTTRTQLVMASVPGVDTAFAFVPRTVTTRIKSRVEGELRDDGTILLQIESTPEEGEQYLPTRTVLTGRRTSKAAK